MQATRLQRKLAHLVGLCQDEAKDAAVEVFEMLNLFLDEWAWDDNDNVVNFYQDSRRTAK